MLGFAPMTGVDSAAAGGGSANTSMLGTLTSLGLTSGLQLCLDAGDINSYASGQTWLDTSGNACHFYRGTTSGSDVSDPTFHGTPGNLSANEYWAYDGGDYFTVVGGNTSFFNSLHKDNAIYTIVQVFYANGIATDPHHGGGASDAGDLGAGGTTGIGLTFGNLTSSGSGRQLFVTVANPSLAMSCASTASFNDNAWNFVAMSFTEATGGGTFQLNGTQESISGKTYSSPSASAATYPFQIGAIGGGLGPDASGCRVAGEMMWNRALSTTELTSVYTAIRGRFGF